MGSASTNLLPIIGVSFYSLLLIEDENPNFPKSFQAIDRRLVNIMKGNHINNIVDI